LVPFCCRAADAHDLWTVSASFSRQQPQTTKVLIRTDPDAASVNDDSADAQRRQGHAKQSLSRQTRSKHTLDEPILRGTPKQKRSRYADSCSITSCIQRLPVWWGCMRTICSMSKMGLSGGTPAASMLYDYPVCMKDAVINHSGDHKPMYLPSHVICHCSYADDRYVAG